MSAADDSDERHDHAPAELADVHLTDRPHVAGGWGAIAATTRFLFRDTGLVRGGKALLAMNQADGFDCPGCAWPEPPSSERQEGDRQSSAKRSTIEFCENGAKALAEEATSARATPALFAKRSIDDLRALSDFELGQLGRITEPLIKDAGSRHYRAATWDQALAVIAAEMRIAGPARTALYTSGRTSNEAAFLYQLVGRWFGTNHFPDCSNMCHESSGVALSEVIGVGKGTVSLADFELADLVLVLGQNPGTNHPRMLTTLRDAARRGADIVSINPLREVGLERFAHPQKALDLVGSGVALARDFVQVQIGGDLAFVRGVAKAILEARAVDLDFIRDRTTGFDAWRDEVAATSWAALERGAGVGEDAMRRIAGRYADADRTIACWAMGLTQHKDAVATIQEIVNLMLVRGNIGRPGAGLCPVRGHSNVQGDRTMGITPRPGPAFLDALAARFGFEPPREPGLDTVDTVRAIERGEITAFVAMGGNFAAACSDTARTAAALERCAITAGVTTKLNRTHLYPGRRAVILPCLGRSEIDDQAGGPQFVTVEDSMSIVHRSRGVLPPAAPSLRSEPAIVAGLGRALLGDVLPWDELIVDYDRIRDLIAAVVPGFDDFTDRIRERDGFQLPNSARDGTFAAVGGRAAFTVSPLPDLALAPARLRMMTLRSHDQYNTTVYGLDDRYRGIRGERRVVLVNSADMVELGLIERQVVDVISEWRGERRVAPRFIVVPYDIPRRNCATYFPEANVLVPLDSVADKSNTPTSKSVVVRLVPTTSRSAP